MVVRNLRCASGRRPCVPASDALHQPGYEDAPMSRKTGGPLFGGSGRKWRAEWEWRRLRKLVARALTIAPWGRIADEFC